MLRPYFSDGNITLYHGDCREILPQLEPESVDLILTDPPYGVSYVTNMVDKNDPMAQPIVGDEDLNMVRDVLPYLDRILRNDRHIYMFGATMRLGENMEAMGEYWKLKNVLVWDKGLTGTVGDLTSGYGWNWEAIVYATKGSRPLNRPRPRCIYRYDWNSRRDPVHPMVKPVGLLQWIIHHSSDSGEMVLDPFCGSGTTLRAAKNLGRQAIGIEYEERYCEEVAKRLMQAVMPGFEEVPCR